MDGFTGQSVRRLEDHRFLTGAGRYVDDITLPGIGAVVLNGAKIGRNCLVGAGSLVTEGKEFPDGSLIVGAPAKVVRELTDAQKAAIHKTVAELKVPVNAGSIDMLAQLGEVSPGHPVWLRLNPGFGHGHSNKTTTGGEHSKHGIWHADLGAALAAVRRHGLQLGHPAARLPEGVVGRQPALIHRRGRQGREADHVAGRVAVDG